MFRTLEGGLSRSGFALWMWPFAYVAAAVTAQHVDVAAVLFRDPAINCLVPVPHRWQTSGSFVCGLSLMNSPLRTYANARLKIRRGS